MAVLATRPESSLVGILVTAAASPDGERLHRSAIVVAQETLRLGVRADEGQTGLRRVVEPEVGTQHVPALAGVTEAAVRRKGVVGDHGATLGMPLVSAHREHAGRGDRGRDREGQPQ